ncbi:type II TA system antitoxin MqsA family protein [Haliangium sp.]|uniref:type II TA system antitoxin MqsA family protein n=1 Tax=Haliangium sp. TaxID=2663208 RepID=UPI003D0BFD89
MKCLMCGADMKTTIEDVEYDEVGLPGVTLVGIEVSRCPACGEVEKAIPMLEGLHRALAMTIITKPGRLSGVEIKFLRKFLGFSGEDFAEVTGADPSTVSRWENDKQPMNAQADRLLRMMVMYGDRVQTYSLKMLAEVGKEQSPSTTRYKARRAESSGWHADIAA